MIRYLLLMALVACAGASLAETIDGSTAGDRAIQGTHRAIEPAYQQRDSAPAELRQPQHANNPAPRVRGYVRPSQPSEVNRAERLDDELERRRKHMQGDTAD